MKVEKIISEDEAALYDRQIRLWGVDAQRRLLSSRILLITMNGLGAEIAKNLVLSGINSLTILDSNEITDKDLKTNFLFNQTSLGKNRAESCVENLQILNPMVKIIADNGKFEEKDDDYFSDKNFDIVCALLDDLQVLKNLNEICRKNNILFLSGFVYGLFGYMFVDFNEFKFIAEATKVVEETTERKTTLTNGKSCPNSEKQTDKLALEERSVSFKSFAEFLKSFASVIENTKPNRMKRISKTYFLIMLIVKFQETYNKSFQATSSEDLENLIKLKNAEFERLKIEQEILDDSFLSSQNFEIQPSVHAILGGVIAQEIIKAISKKNEPIDNFFVFDGYQMSGDVIKV